MFLKAIASPKNTNSVLGTGGILLKKISIVLALLFFSSAAFAYPLNASDIEIINALNYLKSRQDSDGCIGGFATSAWVISGIVAAGENPSSTEWSSGSKSLVECIKKDSFWFNDPSRNATDFERQIIAIVASGGNPANFNGLDYVAKLKSMYDGTQMGNSSYINDDVWGVIALIAAGEPDSSTEIQGMIAFIESNQGADNGWSWGVGQSSDADSTADAIMALIATGETTSSTEIQNAIDYLKSQQDSNNAGFMSWGTANPDSTSHSVDAIVSVGGNPTDALWEENGTNPAEYLLSWQQANGGFSNPYTDPLLGSSEWTTANALNALLGKPYPVEVIEDFSMNVRIEGPTETIMDKEIVLPDSIEFISIGGSSYTLTEPSLLMGLLQAGTENGFSVSVSDEWFPSIGFYVTEIAGYEAEGMDGWNYRIDYHTTGFHSADSFIWQESTPPSTPHREAAWFYGSWDANALRITADSTNIEVGEDVNVLVEYYHEEDNAWYPLEEATVKGSSNEKTTNEKGIATINFSSGGTKYVFAEKEGGDYYRSKKLEFNVEGSEQTSSTVELTGEVIPAIAFSVSPSSLDFGFFGPGYFVSGPTLLLDNKGSWNLEVEAEVTDNEGSLYSSALLLNGTSWNDFSISIMADRSDFFRRENISTALNVPTDYSGTGTETGTLTLWANATGIPS